MRLRVWLWLLCVGCASKPEHVPELAPAHGTAEKPPSPEEQLAESLRRLQAAVEALSGEAALGKPSVVERALRELANAIEFLPTKDETLLKKLRHAADRLHLASDSQAPHASLIRDGLSAALGMLALQSVSSERRIEYERTVLGLGKALDQVSPERPLPDQSKQVQAAFRAAADAVFLARDAEPPFGELDGATAASPETGRFEAEIEQARVDVGALARARWGNTRTAAARALSSLAEVIVAADRQSQCKRQLSDMRLQIERLENTGAFTFGQAQWIKAGLTAALEAFDLVYSAESAGVLEWSAAARRAVAGIDDTESLGFQRATVQDGFRATVDAFAFAATR